jgi:cytidine deaminase
MVCPSYSKHVFKQVWNETPILPCGFCKKLMTVYYKGLPLMLLDQETCYI